MPFGEATRLPLTVIPAYIERLPAVKAELTLLLNEAISLAFAKEDDKRREVRRLRGIIEEHQPQAKKATPKILQRLGIGVHKPHERKSG
jgi:hypothetical protein